MSGGRIFGFRGKTVVGLYTAYSFTTVLFRKRGSCPLLLPFRYSFSRIAIISDGVTMYHRSGKCFKFPVTR